LHGLGEDAECDRVGLADLEIAALVNLYDQLLMLVVLGKLDDVFARS